MQLYLLPLADDTVLPVWADGIERAAICTAVLLAVQYGLVKPGGRL